MTQNLDGGTVSGLPVIPSIYGTVQTILNVAAQQLQDTTGTKWDPSVMVPYLNLAIIEIINLKPDAYPTTKNLTLIAGARQELASATLRLIDAVCNMGTAGTTRGVAIRSIKKEQMDMIIPGWMSFPDNTVVQFVVTDDRDPKTFYVFPPQPTSGFQMIEVVVSDLPDEISAVDGIFPLDDSYRPACIHYIVYAALSEETTIPNAQAKALTFKGKFMEDLGLKTNAEKQSDAEGK